MQDNTYSGRKDHKHQDGVALILRQEAAKALIGYDLNGLRIIKARFKTACGKATILQVYAPTSTSTNEEIDNFYAKVGKKWETWRGVIGKFGLGEPNERVERLLNFCLTNNLKIMYSVFYQRKENRKWTWESPDGTTQKNMIDYIMVNDHWKNCVSSCCSFPKMIRSSVSDCKCTDQVKENICRTNDDTERLKDEPVRLEYENMLKKKSAEIMCN